MTVSCQWATSPCASITVLAYDLLDYSVSPREQRNWDFEVNCFSRFSIDEQVKSGWLLNRQITGDGPVQYPSNVVPGTAKNFPCRCAVCQKYSSFECAFAGGK